MDLGWLIKKDHDEYRRFFVEMAKTSPQDAQAREAALREVMRKIYAHHIAEEVSIFPKMMQVPELRGLAFELEVEHSDMKTLFEALKAERANTEVWKYRLVTIYDVMHAHWLKEEEQLTPFWQGYFSVEEWENFSKQFEQATEHYLKNH